MKSFSQFLISESNSGITYTDEFNNKIASDKQKIIKDELNILVTKFPINFMVDAGIQFNGGEVASASKRRIHFVARATNKSENIKDLRFNVTHEFAHVLLFQITNTDYWNNDRKAPDLEKLFKEYKKGKEGYFSAYSKRNLDEFAAELFAGYLIYGEPPKGAFGGSYLKKVYDWFVDNFNKKA